MVLDTTKNTGASGVKEPAIISGVHSRTKILVVPTNEELGIAVSAPRTLGLPAFRGLHGSIPWTE